MMRFPTFQIYRPWLLSVGLSIEKAPIAKPRRLAAGRASFIEKIPHRRLLDHKASATFGHAHAAIIVDKTLPGYCAKQARAFVVVRGLGGVSRRSLSQLRPAHLKELQPSEIAIIQERILRAIVRQNGKRRVKQLPRLLDYRHIGRD